MPKGMQDNPIEKRLRRQMEGIYENEALTSEMDDDSAAVFLKWVADRVEKIVQSTAEMDDAQAEEALYPRMRAIRKMSRYINQMVQGGGDLTQLTEKIISQAKEVYGDAYREPDLTKIHALFHLPQSEPSVLIQTLRHLFEGETLDDE
jgi:hypothetical protein